MDVKLNKESRTIIELMIADGIISRYDAEKYFPELKESEDEGIRKSLIKSYTNQHSSNFPTVDGFTREQILAWLEKQGSQNLANSAKTCKDEQNPAWSDEDEIRFESTLHRMEMVGRGCAFGQLKDDIEWFKSIKKRYTWKPSDEQIETLNEVIKEAAKMGGRLSKYSKKVQCLESLYNVLKKLKG